MQPLVLFDLDNTLVDRQRGLADWAAGFRSAHGLDREAEQWLRSLLANRATPAHFEQVRQQFGLAGSVRSLWEGYCRELAAAVVCPPSVLAGLEELRADGWRVGVLTNGATDIQTAKLRATGIAARVDAVCVSEEAGARKPDAALFRTALRRCGGDSGGVFAWMVGDSPVNDVGGGRAAGLRTVWVNHGLSWPAELPEPSHQVADAREAIDLLLSTTRREEPKRRTT